MMKREKIYAVTFIRYTNALNDTVSDWDGECDPLKADTKYLDVKQHPCLVKESDLAYFQKFGGGFECIKLVGYLYESEYPVISVDSTAVDFNINTSEIAKKIQEAMKDQHVDTPYHVEIGDQHFKYTSSTVAPHVPQGYTTTYNDKGD